MTTLSIDSTIALGSGKPLPVLGFGVYQVLDPRASTILALEAGYRQIDSARVYRNEAAVGDAVAAASSVASNKDEIYLTSKLQGKHHARAKALAAVEDSIATLAAVGLKWDLYLLHDATSGPIRRLEAWRVLEQKVEEGELQAIGVSNFVSCISLFIVLALFSHHSRVVFATAQCAPPPRRNANIALATESYPPRRIRRRRSNETKSQSNRTAPL